MFEQDPEKRVRIVSQGYNSWRVQVLFSNVELSASEVSELLREVKAELAKHFGVPDLLLEYKQLISKSVTRNGLLVQIQITKQEFPSGAPKFRALPMQLPDGTIFSDMRLEATLHPYDEFDRPLTRATVEARLRAEGYDPYCVQWPVVIEALERMERTMEPVKDLVIGEGSLPSVGNSSRLTYGVPVDQELFMESAWMGLRPVRLGEFLVEVSSATTGYKWGRNVYGRELEPRPGLHTRLVEGDGTRLVMRGTQLIAMRDGLVMFSRPGKDKRDRDTADLVPVKVTAVVVPVNIITESQVFDLDLTEPTAIYATIEPGSRIHTSQPLYIEGDVREGSVIQCAGSARIAGFVDKADISCGRHLCVTGDVKESSLRAELTLHLDGHVVESSLWGTDVVAGEITGGTVEALHQTSIRQVHDTGGRAAAIRVNLHKYLENRQLAGQEALIDLRQSLSQIIEIFGQDLALEITEDSAQRVLLKWLRKQKATGAVNYTHSEVQELRAVLEMIPLIREQAKAIGLELRDISTQLEQEQPPEVVS